MQVISVAHRQARGSGPSLALRINSIVFLRRARGPFAVAADEDRDRIAYDGCDPLAIPIVHKGRRGGATESATQAEIRLCNSGIVRLEGDRRGLEIHALEGSLWVTQQDDINDHVLDAGDRFIICRRGLVVVQSMGEAVLKMTPAKFLPTDKFVGGRKGVNN
jgi:hypothetical protein